MVYKRITNFGMQRFRMDYTGSRNLSLTEEKTMDFKILECRFIRRYVCCNNIPDVWSALVKDTDDNWVETGFKWIEELGTTMIKKITIHTGGTTLASYTGEYLSAVVQRDYNEAKKDLWNRMTGNMNELK